METIKEYSADYMHLTHDRNTQCQNKECFHNDDSESGCESHSLWFIDLCEEYKPTQEKE